MTDKVNQWLMARVMEWAWAYLSAHWVSIALFIAVAVIVCALVLKLLSRVGALALAVGVVILSVCAWGLGYRSAPVRTQVRTVVNTKVVEKPIIDHAEVNRLRKRVADLAAEKNAALKAAEGAAKLRRELADARGEIDRLLAELAAKPPVKAQPDYNAQCPNCGYLTNIGKNMKNEQMRCRNCGAIWPTPVMWARRAFVLSRQNHEK